MRHVPPSLSRKPTTPRDEMEVMLQAEAAQKAALANQAAYLQTHDEEDYRAAMLFHAEAQTLWAQAQFYGTNG